VIGGWQTSFSNFGLHKDLKVGERVTDALGADFDNIFNHPIRMPNLDFADSSFSYLGGFNIQIDPNTLQPQLKPDPTNPTGFAISPNSDFGRAFSTSRRKGSTADAPFGCDCELRFSEYASPDKTEIGLFQLDRFIDRSPPIGQNNTLPGILAS